MAVAAPFTLRLVPPAAFALTLAGMLALDALLPGAHVAPQGQSWMRAWASVGGALVIAGAALHLRAWRALRGAGGPIDRVAAPPRLVTEGPYRWSRNPMYLAGIVILTGLALLLGSATPFLGVAAFGAWSAARVVRAEEALLEAELGEEYRAYRERVRRWI